MKNWVLTTVRYDRPGDRYTNEILPITLPLMQLYADRWDMRLVVVNVPQEAASQFPFIPTRGTECVYASMPKRLELLERYDGVVYLDGDAVIMDPMRDICAQVVTSQPVGMIDGLTGAVQVLKSTPETCKLLADCWAEREYWGRQHWAEEGFFKKAFGYNHVYQPMQANRAEFVSPTPLTEMLTVLDDEWCWHPGDPRPGNPRIMNPGGIWPFEKRLEIITEAAREGMRNAIRQ